MKKIFHSKVGALNFETWSMRHSSRYGNFLDASRVYELYRKSANAMKVLALVSFFSVQQLSEINFFYAYKLCAIEWVTENKNSSICIKLLLKNHTADNENEGDATGHHNVYFLFAFSRMLFICIKVHLNLISVE
jgi:hypothetical protein